MDETTECLLEKSNFLSNEKIDANIEVTIKMQDLNIRDELVYINVSGQPFITTVQTLNNFPDSLLGNKERRDQLQKTNNGEIFLNRHPKVFRSILTFYRYGILEQPSRVNQLIFVDDVKYYGLIAEALEVGVKGFHKEKKVYHQRKWQTYVWNILEYPDSSLAARIFSLFSLLTIILSIVVFCMETLPVYKEKKGVIMSSDKQFIKNALDDLEKFCIIYFTIEIITRFLFSPSKWRFIKNILNIIDIISILPFYVTIVLHTKGSYSIYFLRAIRLVRVFRVFKLSRHSNEMIILGVAMKESFRELIVLVFFILLGVLLFSSAVYYAEDGTETTFTSIPQSFWWSIVTMTTVGYGDEYPKSQLGKLVGAVCAMTGILVIAMPIPIIVNNFTQQYQVLRPGSKYWDVFQHKNDAKKKDIAEVVDC
ncbi:potassium voltage-gated channel subfamily A member 10 isoform X1 [Hydra vulgaris]|uniref:potassium voltage-gated channel subfamily A member 10 isoform X1 n=2 Tax=Hydra vulgaris TaxID=6087 RepID=UPI0002B47B54|nr:potassium voltage-gated channel subfamily A member 10-like isoform X1 [Hydra vulgaris]